MSATDRSNDELCPILTLPREIRDEIYRLCVPRNNRIAIYQRSQLPPSARFPIGVAPALAPYPDEKECLALLDVSQQIRAEATSVLLQDVVPYIEQVELGPDTTPVGFRPATFLQRDFSEVKSLELQILESISEADQVIKKLLPPKVEHLKPNFHPAFLGPARCPTWANELDALLQRKSLNRFHPELYIEQYLSILPEEGLRLRRRAPLLLGLPKDFVEPRDNYDEDDSEDSTDETDYEFRRSDHEFPSALGRECPTQLKVVTIVIPTLNPSTVGLQSSIRMPAEFSTHDVGQEWLTQTSSGCYILRHLKAIDAIPPGEGSCWERDIRSSETVFDFLKIEGTPIIEYGAALKDLRPTSERATLWSNPRRSARLVN